MSDDALSRDELRAELARLRDAHADLAAENARLLSESAASAAALARTQQLLEETQRLGQMGSYEWDIHTDELCWSNGMHALFDTDPQTWKPTKENLIGHIHPDDRPAFQARLDLALQNPRMISAEYRVVHRSGEVRHLHTVSAFVLDAAGRPVRLVGVAQDITERKRAEEALLRSNAVLRAQQEAGIDGILVVDEHLRVISFNRRFTELWHLSLSAMDVGDDEALLAQVAAQLRDPAEFRARVDDLYRHPQESSRDEVYLRDGRVFDRYSAPAVSPLGQYFGRIWYFRDITDRKQLEARLEAKNTQLQELNHLQSNFVHSVSHELRTPLTSIVGYSEFLEDSLEGAGHPDLLEYVHQIQRSTWRLERLLDDLLDFALIEAGTFRLKPELTELGDKVLEIAESFRPQVTQAGLELKVTLPETPLLVTADAQRVGQVLTNFIGNAVKLTPPGGRIGVRAIAHPDAMRVEVCDTGPGIRPEELPRLFQRFSQLESGIKRGGAGLGLSISKGLIEAHGGTIGVESAPGEGSTFWFTLPTSPHGPDARGDGQDET
jgi:signal transduction histidine kinase